VAIEVGEENMAETSHKGFVRLALVTAVLVWFLIALGGVVRVTGSGLGCGDDWPLCDGSFLPAFEFGPIIEYAHRTVAALVSLFVLLTAIGAWRRYRVARWVVLPATLGLVLLVVQVFLGAVTVWLELPPEIVVAHLAAALAILALSIVAAVAARYPRAETQHRSSANLTGLLWLTVPALFVLLLSGGLVTGSGASAACPTFPLCVGFLIPEQGFPLQRIHMLHRLWMAILAVLVALVVINANRGGHPRVIRVWSWVLAGTFAAQMVVGMTQVLFGLPAALRAAHVALASGIWASIVVLATLVALHGERRAVADPKAPDGPGKEPLTKTARVLGDYLQLTKPIIVSLLLFTTLTGMVVAAGGLPPLGMLLATLTGGALSAAGANTINQYLERDIDALMRRTRKRPIPSGAIKPVNALVFGLALSAASFVMLWLLVNLLSAVLATLGIAYYVLVYTVLLKRSTPQNIVVGGVAGAIPPLVGWAAVTNRIDVLAIFLFAIVFYWTPPHTWALVLLVKNDYARASIPMLPVAKGVQATTVRILLYTLLLVPLTLMLTPLRLMGLFYLTAALVLGGWHVVEAVRVYRQQSKAAARRLYKFSTAYLCWGSYRSAVP
jgi:protoheme IX farnesyltransferase